MQQLLLEREIRVVIYGIYLRVLVGLLHWMHGHTMLLNLQLLQLQLNSILH